MAVDVSKPRFKLQIVDKCWVVAETELDGYDLTKSMAQTDILQELLDELPTPLLQTIKKAGGK